MFIREYMITLCAFGDQDKVPTCSQAAIQVPDDVADDDVPEHTRQLMVQIANELPMFVRKQYGTTPRKADLFWMCQPNPYQLEEGGVIAWPLRGSSS